MDNFVDNQSVQCRILMDSINNNKISHAYIVDENNNNDAFLFVLSFVKEILKKDFLNIDSNYDIESLYKRIDENNFPEIKIINPDGMLIKKQQIIDLQKDFAMDPVEGIRRIYIIRDADKMRSETANSMLKFLEEPTNNVIAILMTNNYNNILSTIISRCQIIKLNNVNFSNVDNLIFDTCINFVMNLESNGIKTIINEKELLFDKIGIKEREKFIIFFDYMIDIYYDVIKVYNKIYNCKYSDLIDKYNDICSNNSFDSLLRKIDILLDYREYIKYNVNVNLLIDNLIISIGGV